MIFYIDEILTYAKETLKRRLHEGAYITLADHINFSVIRLKQGMNFQNVLLTEIRRFYPQEYAIGIFALELMKDRLGIIMPEDEEFYKIITRNYQKETQCSKKIAAYVRKEDEYEMSLEEISSLTIHIKRISTLN